MGIFGKYISDERIREWLPRLSDGGDFLYEENGLLYLYPAAKASEEPLIDSLTRKMTAAFHQADSWKVGFGGSRSCSCGKAKSASHDFTLPNGLFINSLCIHYLSRHREEIPRDQLDIVANLDFGEVVPKPEEINPDATTFNHIGQDS